MFLRTFSVLATVSAFAVAQTPSKSGNATGNLSTADRKFVEEAIQGNRAEVALGRLASQKAVDPQVKAFGDMMVKDHTQGLMELESLARDKGVTLPAEKQPPAQAKLSKLSGAAFDKAYVSDMVADHKKDVAEFKKESTSAANTDVRNLASKMLPTLQMHLDQILMLQSQSGKTADRTVATPARTNTDSHESPAQPNNAPNPKQK